MKGSCGAAKRTVARRNQFLKNQLEFSAGSSNNSLELQTGKLLKSFGDEEQRKIVVEANISPVEIDAEQMVAMKVDLGIPWEKPKTMSR